MLGNSIDKQTLESFWCVDIAVLVRHCGSCSVQVHFNYTLITRESGIRTFSEILSNTASSKENSKQHSSDITKSKQSEAVVPQISHTIYYCSGGIPDETFFRAYSGLDDVRILNWWRVGVQMLQRLVQLWGVDINEQLTFVVWVQPARECLSDIWLAEMRMSATLLAEQ